MGKSKQWYLNDWSSGNSDGCVLFVCLFFERSFALSLGRSTVAPSRLTATSTSQVQAILPQPLSSSWNCKCALPSPANYFCILSRNGLSPYWPGWSWSLDLVIHLPQPPKRRESLCPDFPCLSWFDRSVLFIVEFNISLYGCLTVCLSIHLLKDILLVPKFFGS